MHTELEHEQAVARLLWELPGEAAEPYDYREFQRRRHARPAGPVRLAGGQSLAAAVVCAVAIAAATIRFGEFPQPPAATAPGAAERGAAQPRGDGNGERDDADAERWLAALPREPAVVRVGTRAAVETLEDRIAQVDDLLSAGRAGQASPARLQVLQQQRTRLVSSLAQVRYAETLADASR
jgi:hypothetical protein